jgi:hypothetical protein
MTPVCQLYLQEIDKEKYKKETSDWRVSIFRQFRRLKTQLEPCFVFSSEPSPNSGQLSPLVGIHLGRCKLLMGFRI